jgi:predicted nuclease with TOPRIM domain
MLSEEIRGIANYVIVGLLIDNKIIRLLYTIANKVEKLEDDLDRAEGERMQFGDRIVQLQIENDRLNITLDQVEILTDRIEKKLDLHIEGLEGAYETNEQLLAKSEALDILLENVSSISIQGKMRMIAIGLGAWKRAMDRLKDK